VSLSLLAPPSHPHTNTHMHSNTPTLKHTHQEAIVDEGHHEGALREGEGPQWDPLAHEGLLVGTQAGACRLSRRMLCSETIKKIGMQEASDHCLHW
jgi:hypothetical protein